MKKILLLICIAVIGVFSGCSKQQGLNSGQQVKEEVSGETQSDNNALGVDEGLPNESSEEKKKESKGELSEGIFPGNMAVDVVLPDREGNEVRLSDYKGKVVFLNFWASWCGPCQSEMPDLQKIYEEYKDKDFVILAVNYLESEKVGKEGVEKFLDDNNYTFPVLFDEKSKAVSQYGIRGIPTTYIINQEGVIVNVASGAIDKEKASEYIDTLLQENEGK